MPRQPRVGSPQPQEKVLSAAYVDRLAEYGWKPHRDCLARKNLSRASVYWHMHETQRGTVSSKSRFQTVLFQQYSANLSYVHKARGPCRSACQPRRAHIGPYERNVQSPDSELPPSENTLVCSRATHVALAVRHPLSQVRSISVLRFWTSEGSTQAEF